LPIDWIEARDEKEAKKKVLLAMSQYGKYKEKSLMEYIGESGVDLEELNLKMDIPGIDIEKLLEMKKKGESPEVDFATELLESHNFVVLYFDNEVDWLQAQTLFELKPVRALHTREGFMTHGVGRVIKGSKAIEKIKEKLGEMK
jgi:hypothetical protein